MTCFKLAIAAIPNIAGTQVELDIVTQPNKVGAFGHMAPEKSVQVLWGISGAPDHTCLNWFIMSRSTLATCLLVTHRLKHLCGVCW